jgi:hypothetical protein
MTWLMYGSDSTHSPTSKSPIARERHRPPGHSRSGPTPIAPLPRAGPPPVTEGGRFRDSHYTHYMTEWYLSSLALPCRCADASVYSAPVRP